MEMLPEPPDGMLKSALALTLILFVYMYPILRGIIRLWARLLHVYIWKKRDNIFVRHGRRRGRHKRHNLMPTKHVKVFATANTNEESFSWDTDGMPFVIDNSATAIICNSRKKF